MGAGGLRGRLRVVPRDYLRSNVRRRRAKPMTTNSRAIASGRTVATVQILARDSVACPVCGKTGLVPAVLAGEPLEPVPFPPADEPKTPLFATLFGAFPGDVPLASDADCGFDAVTFVTGLVVVFITLKGGAKACGSMPNASGGRVKRSVVTG